MAVNENKWGLLYCPRNGWREGKRWLKIEKVLRQQHIDYDFVQSENQKSVERLVKMFINNGYKTIVIVGGDSALNDAVNCLMQVDKATREGIALGVIPHGMMNDFAHFWGFSDSDQENRLGLYPLYEQARREVPSLLPELHQRGLDCRYHESAPQDPSLPGFPHTFVHLFFCAHDFPAPRLQDACQDQ